MFGLFKRSSPIPSNAVVAPVNGKIIPLSEVKDEVFAQHIMGDGAAIEPSDGMITAPCSGTITMLYPTLHAFGIKSEDGLELLVHIGINTVNLKGRGFKAYVRQGDRVKINDQVIHIDIEAIHQAGYETTVMILYPNCQYSLNISRNGSAKRGQTILTTYERR